MKLLNSTSATFLDVEVVRLLAFGAIVKLSDKVEGLVHISEIAPERIEAPSDVLEVGQVVKAEIIKMDLDSKKNRPEHFQS